MSARRNAILSGLISVCIMPREWRSTKTLTNASGGAYPLTCYAAYDLVGNLAYVRGRKRREVPASLDDVMERDIAQLKDSAAETPIDSTAKNFREQPARPVRYDRDVI